MIKNCLLYSILVLAVVCIVFGCANMKKPTKTEKTWIQEIEELSGGRLLAIDWSDYYPIESMVQRYYVFILRNEIPELKQVDIDFKDFHVIERIKLVDIDESDITRYNAQPRVPIKQTASGGPGWIGGGKVYEYTRCRSACLTMCINVWGFGRI